MPAAPHNEFPFTASLNAGQPLVTLEVALVAMRLRRVAQVRELVECGDIEWAWDISTPGAERSELRVFWRCCVPGWRGQMTEPQIYNEVIPSHWGRVTAARLAERMMCSDDLIATLIPCCFTALTAPRRGLGGSPELTRTSVVQWLATRRVMALQPEEAAP